VDEANSRPVGVGFFIAPNQVLTCAHVVNAAIGRPLTEQASPKGAYHPKLILPLQEDDGGRPGPSRISTEVQHWSPPVSDGFGVSDIACLQTPAGALPAAVTPVALADPRGSLGSSLDLFGYPASPPRPMGAWTRCRLINKVTGGLWQLDQDLQSALQVQPGYSGSPLWDSSLGVVVGMLVVAAVPGSAGLNAYAIPSSRLLAAWPSGATEENLRRSTNSAITNIQINVKRARAVADVNFTVGPAACLDLCQRALSAMRLRRLTVDAQVGILEARTHMGLRTWGDKITVTIKPQNFGAHVQVRSEPVMTKTVYNYGVARNNVVRVLVALNDVLEDS
jgi:hypothetical protein